MTLSRWERQGWLKRITQGVYVPTPVDSTNDEHILDEPWALAPALFGCDYYIGGFSAASYWELTEQTFRSIFVFTSKAVKSRKMELEGYRLIIKTVKKEKTFEKKKIQKGDAKLYVSNIYKTLVDMLRGY